MRSSPSARKGRSEAEWLDRAEDRRTISRRDGRMRVATATLSARTARTNEARWLEDRQEVAVDDRLRRDSERVRVHLYERSFRQKPVRRVRVDEVDAGVAHDTGGALGGVTDEARFCRTTATCIWGVSDPLRIEARDRDRGVAEGVAHAPDASVTAADSRADCDTGGTERRPVQRSEVAHCKEHRRTNAPRNSRRHGRAVGGEQSPGRGNTAPGSVFPPCGRTFIRKLRILDGVEFIEAPTFTAIVADYLEDDKYRALQLVPGRGSGGRRCHAGHRRLSQAAMGRSAPRQGQAWWPQGDLLPPFGRCSDLADDALRQGRNGRPERR